MLSLISALLLALVGILLTVRITEKPLRIPFTVTETGANTFTTTTINVPGVPSIAVTRGGDAKGIGLEVMKVVSDHDKPDPEPGVANELRMGLSKGAAPTAALTVQDKKSILVRVTSWEHEDATGVEAANQSEDVMHFDLTDGDGNGELVFDDEIHVWVAGVGNAAAKRTEGYLLVHLVEYTGNEAIFELLEAV